MTFITRLASTQLWISIETSCVPSSQARGPSAITSTSAPSMSSLTYSNPWQLCFSSRFWMVTAGSCDSLDPSWTLIAARHQRLMWHLAFQRVHENTFQVICSTQRHTEPNFVRKHEYVRLGFRARFCKDAITAEEWECNYMPSF